MPLFELTLGRIAETLRRAHADPRMGLRLPQTFEAAGLPSPQLMAHARISGAKDPSSYAQIAGVVRTLLPAMEKFGVAKPAEIDIDTLAERLQAAAVSRDATVVAPLFVGAWSRKSSAI